MINYNLSKLYPQAAHFVQEELPETKTIPHLWYNTPNIHLATIRDFRELCSKRKLKIDMEIPTGSTFDIFAGIWPNLFAQNCVFVISKE